MHVCMYKCIHTDILFVPNCVFEAPPPTKNLLFLLWLSGRQTHVTAGLELAYFLRNRYFCRSILMMAENSELARSRDLLGRNTATSSCMAMMACLTQRWVIKSCGASGKEMCNYHAHPNLRLEKCLDMCWMLCVMKVEKSMQAEQR